MGPPEEPRVLLTNEPSLCLVVHFQVNTYYDATHSRVLFTPVMLQKCNLGSQHNVETQVSEDNMHDSNSESGDGQSWP